MFDLPDSVPRIANVDLLLSVAEEFHALARALAAAGQPEVGLHLHKAASSLDRVLPQAPAWWTNPFNGQEGRCHLFLNMIDALRPAAIVETGTYRGTTTAFMADHFVGPIFTCEADPRWYFTAKAVLARFPRVDIRDQDSRDFLRAILAETNEDPIFYYLDAHWEDDLPLQGELEMILSQGRPAAIMIDDFAVPSDPDYCFDDYGPGKALTTELLLGMKAWGASLYFPTLPAARETGARRGCAVIGTHDVTTMLARLPGLAPYDWPDGNRANDPGVSVPSHSHDLGPLQHLVTARGQQAERDSLRQRAEVAEAERDIQRGRAEAAEAERETQRGRAEAAESEREAQRGRAEAAEIERDTQRRRAEAAEVERDSSRSRANLAEASVMVLRNEHDALLDSTSWRITAPLRGVRRLLKQQ